MFELKNLHFLCQIRCKVFRIVNTLLEQLSSHCYFGFANLLKRIRYVVRFNETFCFQIKLFIFNRLSTSGKQNNRTITISKRRTIKLYDIILRLIFVADLRRLLFEVLQYVKYTFFKKQSIQLLKINGPNLQTLHLFFFVKLKMRTIWRTFIF